MTVAVARTMSDSATGAPSAPSSPFSNAATLGKDDFVKLLVAQLKHQDPLNPQDGTQMATQLAQFSSVEQLMNINSTLATQGGANTALASALENASAISLIGKRVSIATDQVTIGHGSPGTFATELPADGDLTVSLVDRNGKIVRSERLKGKSAGRTALDINGLSSGLGDGTYTIKLTLTRPDGSTSTPPSFLTTIVDGVQFGPSGLVLRSGTRTYPLTGVTSVDAAN